MLHQLGRDALGLSDHFELLGELGLIDDLAFFHRAAVVGTDILEQMHHLLRRQILRPCVGSAADSRAAEESGGARQDQPKS